MLQPSRKHEGSKLRDRPGKDDEEDKDGPERLIVPGPARAEGYTEGIRKASERAELSKV